MIRQADIFQLRMERNGQVGHKRPGGGRPNHKTDLRAVVSGKAHTAGFGGGGVVHRKVDKDAGGADVFVFQLGIGQCGFTADGPVDGLELFIDKTVADQFGEDFEDALLIFWLEGQIGIFEITEDAE